MLSANPASGMNRGSGRAAFDGATGERIQGVGMKTTRILLLFPLAAVLALSTPVPGAGQPAPPAHALKRILILGAAQGWQHDSIPDAMATIWQMGHDTGLWEAYIRTDYGLITKGKAGTNAKNLDAFDALVFVNTTGAMQLDEGQKRDLLAFVHDDGKGFVGVHAALDANYDWPEYAEMIGGWFDEHPWMTFDAPIVVEDPSFPAVRHFPHAFTKRDEIYQAKA